MEKVTYFGQVGSVRLFNGTVELVATVDVGPRIIRYGFPGDENILGELPDISIATPLGPWKPWGGHRLWTAPEANPRSYVPDNAPVQHEPEGEHGLHLTQQVERETGIQKELVITLDARGTRVTIRHVITNRNLWAIDVAPWAITNMRAGGTAILPQEPYRSWDEDLLPARPFVLWHYTDLTDPRWTIGSRYICLKSDERTAAPQKAGILNKLGWAAYHHDRTLFIKRFAYEEGASYPDYGSNTEVYAGGSTIEVESLSPIRRLEPGESAIHVETWELFQDVELGPTDEAIESAIGPLVKSEKN